MRILGAMGKLFDDLVNLVTDLAMCPASTFAQLLGLAEVQARVGKWQPVNRFFGIFIKNVASIAEVDQDAYRPQDFQVAIKAANAQAKTPRDRGARLRPLIQEH
jgi:hypothetical protein